MPTKAAARTKNRTHKRSSFRQARDEKVMIIPYGTGFLVVPAQKVVSPGQTVTFRAFGCKNLEIENLDPSAFYDPVHHGPKIVTVDVKASADGPYEYDAVCESKAGTKHARGNSSPGMIVDG